MNHHKTIAEKTTQSYRSGPRATFYDLQRDPGLNNKNVIRDKSKVVFPFVPGSSYKGEWNMDMKEGLGVMVYPDGSKYEGEWSANCRQGKGTLWGKKGKKLVKQYVGEWYGGFRHGQGSQFYDNGDEYIGEWFRDKRTGNGRLNYPSGDYYIGNWEADLQKGRGVLYFDNGNVYEGLWLNGRKEGPGRFYYASTRKIYEGEWVDDQPKCGEFRDPKGDEALRLSGSKIRQEVFTLPPLGLEDSKGILDSTISAVRLENSSKRGVSTGVFDAETIERARVAFSHADISRLGAVPVHSCEPIFETLGISAEQFNFSELFQELEISSNVSLSFPEIIDIAMYIYSNSEIQT